MKSATTRFLVLLLLGSGCVGLATILQPHVYSWTSRSDSDSVLKVLLGDSLRLFANHFFIEADVYFHSGYYPSIFDQARARIDSKHMTSKEGSPEEEEHERRMNFLGPPRDWIESFGRNFLVTRHTHLQGGNEREILPWLRISADLDPQRVETYTVAAYWLRDLGKVSDAEQFLREGLRNNPNSFEILYELGRLYDENDHDSNRARNVWELALRRWGEQEMGKSNPDVRDLEQIEVHLGRLEEKTGRFAQAARYLGMAAKISPDPAALEQQITELKKRAAAAGQ